MFLIELIGGLVIAALLAIGGYRAVMNLRWGDKNEASRDVQRKDENQ